VGYIR